MLVRTISPAPSCSTSRAQLDGLEPGRNSAAVDVHLPHLAPAAIDPLGIDVDHDALAAEPPGGLPHQLGVAHGRRVDRNLVRPRAQERADVVQAPNPAADRQRHETNLGSAPYDVEQDRPAFVTGGDVQENQFIGTLQIITRRHGDGVARVLEVEEVRPLDHTAMIDVEARDDPLGQHALSLPGVPPAVVPAEHHVLLPRRGLIPRTALYSIEER